MKQGLKKGNTLFLFFITTAFSLAVFFVILGTDLASAQWSGPTAEPPLNNRPGYIWNTYGPDVDQQPNSSISVSEKVVSPQFCLPNDTADNCINSWSELDVVDDDWIIDGLNVYRRSGSVGIGTASPSQKLDVVGSATTPARIRVSSESNPEIQLHTGPGSNDHWALYVDAVSGELRLWNPGVDDTGYNFLQIDQLGQLGLNRQPTEKLDVNGAIRIGATTKENAGTIQFTGSDFIGYTGSAWVSLTESGAGNTLPSGAIGQTLRSNGVDWIATNTLLNNGSQVTVNGNGLVTGQFGIGAVPAAGVHFEIADHGLTPSVMRITSNTANPEVQLKYGPASNQHWAMYVNERFVPRQPDQTGVDQQINLLNTDSANAQTTNAVNPLPLGDTKNDLRFWAENGNSNGQGAVIMTMQQNCNVNIGPNLPTEKLVVEGRGWFQQGICLGSDKNCITTWPTGGTGSSLWQQAGSDIYYSTGKVGIGTNSPQYQLDVQAGAANQFSIADAGGDRMMVVSGEPSAPNGSIQFGDIDQADLGEIFNLSLGSQRAYFDNVRLGIGTTNPNADLHVFNDSLNANSSQYAVTHSELEWQAPYNVSNGVKVVAANTNSAKLDFADGASVSNGIMAMIGTYGQAYSLGTPNITSNGENGQVILRGGNFTSFSDLGTTGDMYWYPRRHEGLTAAASGSADANFGMISVAGPGGLINVGIYAKGNIAVCSELEDPGCRPQYHFPTSGNWAGYFDGNLGIAQGELFFDDNGQIRSHDNNHRIIFNRTGNELELREYGDIVFSPGAVNGQATRDAVMNRYGSLHVGDTNNYVGKVVVVDSVDDTMAPVDGSNQTPRATTDAQPSILATTNRNHSAIWGMNYGPDDPDSVGSLNIYAGVTGFAQTGDKRFGVGVAAAGSKYGLTAVTDTGIAGRFTTGTNSYSFTDVTQPLSVVSQGGGFYVDPGQAGYSCFGPLAMCDAITPIFEGVANPDIDIENAGSNFVITGTDRGPGIEFVDAQPSNVMNGNADDHYQAGFGLAVSPALYIDGLQSGDFAIRGISGGIALGTRDAGDLAGVYSRLYVAGENKDGLVTANGTVQSGYVGINTLEPTEQLEIKDGGIKFNTTAARPTCTATRRGTMWFQRGSTNDTMHVCMRKSGVDQWVDITAVSGGLEQPVQQLR